MVHLRYYVGLQGAITFLRVPTISIKICTRIAMYIHMATRWPDEFVKKIAQNVAQLILT
jgi:hypothetical protein